ncbi:MAG: aldo/keto reductase [Solobacterium sp.]|nr:aldo/keto reductase [Solobacterium sp.]
MEYFTLNNGNRMPMAGIGVFLLKPEETELSVLSALTDGIRLIDTANAYMNEKAVGRAMKKSGVAREDIFLVTKLWPTVYTDENAIDETLARLGTDYIDLLFLHQPAGDWRTGYKMMEKAYKEGKVKALGVSNFPIEWLKEIIETAEIKPQMVQVEAHPYYPQTELKKVLAETGMGLMAWYPLGHGDKNLINEPVFTKLAEKYGKSNAQIILRWHVQSGNVIFPGSRNPAHIRDNFNIFDFSLTDEEMAEIANVDRNIRYYNATIEEAQKYAKMTLDFNAQE